MHLSVAEALAHGHFKDGHAPGAQQSHAAHFADNAGHFAGNQFVQAARTQAVFVAEGQVVEQVFDGGMRLSLSSLGDARADALDKLHGVSRASTSAMLSAIADWRLFAKLERLSGVCVEMD